MPLKITYRPEIDGLRAIAILSVVFFHANFFVFNVNPIPGGFLGVDIFFVISGYLITSIILKGLNEGSFSYMEFYERRVRRILPILFTVMLISFPFAWLYLLPQEFIEYANSIIYSIFFSSNFWFFSDDSYWAVNGPRPFLHTWSLAVEEQFYLLMPIMLVFMHKHLRHMMITIVVLLAIISLSYADWISVSEKYPDFGFYMLPTRMWELMAGSMLSILEIQNGRNHKIWMTNTFPGIGLLLICIPFIMFNENTLHPSKLTLIPVIGTMLVIWFAKEGEFVTDTLSSRPLVGIGLISYGLYIWHYPVIVFGNEIVSDPTNLIKFQWIIISFIVTLLTYFLIEKPYRNKYRINKKTVINSATVAALVLLLINYQGLKTGYKDRFPDFVNVTPFPDKNINHVWFSDTPKPSDKRVILVGDSHMQAISQSFKDKFTEAGFAFAESVETGCPLILGLTPVNKRTHITEPNCQEERNISRMSFISNQKPSYVVLGARLPAILNEDGFNNMEGGYDGETNYYYQNSDHSLKSIEERRKAFFVHYKSTIMKIIAQGHTVVLIYPIPEAGWNVPKTIVKKMKRNLYNDSEMLEKEPLTTSYNAFRNRVKSSYELLDSIQHHRIIRIYPENILCNTYIQDRCVTHVNEIILYRDDDHLSKAGADLLVAEIFNKIIASVPPGENQH